MEPPTVIAPRTRRPRLDWVPVVAAFAALLLVALSAARKMGVLVGHPLPRELMSATSQMSWYVYWGSVVVFGLVVIRRWRNTYFRWRTLSTMVSQTTFGLLLGGPLKTTLGIPSFWQRLHLTWPLHMSAITPYLQSNFTNAFIYGVLISLAAWPLATYFIGLRYCSWFCFCGNLAETAGDPFRTKGPKGPSAQGLDNIGYGVLALAGVTTIVLWFTLTWPYDWYDIIVGWFLASTVGVATYPFLGPRVWCRFFCPLRTLLGWVSRRGRFAIYTDDHRCIECGTCNRYCEMGIDVRLRARQGIPMRDTECVACGACIAVCPRYALSFYPFPAPEEATAARSTRRFRAPFRRQLATPRER